MNLLCGNQSGQHVTVEHLTPYISDDKKQHTTSSKWLAEIVQNNERDWEYFLANLIKDEPPDINTVEWEWLKLIFCL